MTLKQLVFSTLLAYNMACTKVPEYQPFDSHLSKSKYGKSYAQIHGNPDEVFSYGKFMYGQTEITPSLPISVTQNVVKILYNLDNDFQAEISLLFVRGDCWVVDYKYSKKNQDLQIKTDCVLPPSEEKNSTSGTKLINSKQVESKPAHLIGIHVDVDGNLGYTPIIDDFVLEKDGVANSIEAFIQTKNRI